MQWLLSWGSHDARWAKRWLTTQYTTDFCAEISRLQFYEETFQPADCEINLNNSIYVNAAALKLICLHVILVIGPLKKTMLFF